MATSIWVALIAHNSHNAVRKKIMIVRMRISTWLPALTAGAAIMFIGTAACPAEECFRRAGYGPEVVLQTVGPVKMETALRVRDYLDGELSLPVEMGPPRVVMGGDLVNSLLAVAADEPGNVIMRILLVSGSDGERHGVARPERAAAAVNIDALRGQVSADVFRRRVERQGMIAAARIMEMGACPNPRCVLRAYETLPQLDEMGLNFCPPCGDRFRGAAEERGAVFRRRLPPPLRSERCD